MNDYRQSDWSVQAQAWIAALPLPPPPDGGGVTAGDGGRRGANQIKISPQIGHDRSNRTSQCVAWYGDPEFRELLA